MNPLHIFVISLLSFSASAVEVPFVRAVQVTPRGGDLFARVVLANRSAVDPDLVVHLRCTDYASGQLLLSADLPPIDAELGSSILQAGQLQAPPSGSVVALAWTSIGRLSREAESFVIDTSSATELVGLIWVSNNDSPLTYTLQPLPTKQELESTSGKKLLDETVSMTLKSRVRQLVAQVKILQLRRRICHLW